MKKRELIIIGAGPAGMSAAVYAARYKIDAEVLTKSVGGVVPTAQHICNYLSYNGISGAELSLKMKKHVESLNIPITLSAVKEVVKEKKGFKIKTSEGIYFAKKVIFAAGTNRIELGAKGEMQFKRKGVSYCTTCDGPFFQGKTVAVVGGGDSALTSAIMMSEHAKKVYLIHRRDEFRAEPMWVDSAKKNKKIQFILNDEVSEISGKEFVEKISLKSGKELAVEGVFVEIGGAPDTSSISNLKLESDEKGYIKVDSKMRSSVKGFFAAGDIVSKNFRQISTAVSDGAISALSAYEELKKE